MYEKFSARISIDTDIKTHSFGKLDLNIELSAFSHPVYETNLKPVSYKIRYGVNTHKVIKGNWTIESHHSRVNQILSLNFGGKPFCHNEFHFEIKYDFMDTLQKIFNLYHEFLHS